MGCIERRKGVRRARGHPPGRRVAPIVHHPLSIINAPGFTLIELLVVIGVIALLMAVLLPALQRARRQAQTMVCRSRLKQWAMTLALYTENYEGHFPTSLSGWGGIWLFRGALLSGYDPNAPERSIHGFSTRDIICCPLAGKPDRSGGFVASFGTTRMEARWDRHSAPGRSRILLPRFTAAMASMRISSAGSWSGRCWAGPMSAFAI